MNKFPIQYLDVLPYSIRETGFHEERKQVSESLFSISNEYRGIRGRMDEGGSFDHTLRGVYFNGIYDYAKEDTPSAYKGIVKRTHFRINSVDWVNFTLSCNGTKLDLGKNKIEDFSRSLDFLSGELVRSFVLVLEDGSKVRLTFSRFLSRSHPHIGFQKVRIENLSGKELHFSLSFALENNVIHWGKDCYWTRENEIVYNGKETAISANTLTSHQKLFARCVLSSSKEVPFEASTSSRRSESKTEFDLKTKEVIGFEKGCAFEIDKKGTKSFTELEKESEEDISVIKEKGYEGLLKENCSFWGKFFQENDIRIDGDEKDQQGIRFSLFQLASAYHGYQEDDNIGAKGLTGEAYSGHAFWDSETYCLPFYLLTDIKAAKDLLLFRYNTLNKAKERAKRLDCSGACYPIATLNGEEGCNLWQHASLQFQPSTGVCYAIFHYYNLTKDSEFIKNYGLEILLEVSHFLLDRGQYDQEGKKFGYYAVRGPDEFKRMVNNNAYTNYRAKKTFEFTLEMFEKYGSDSLLEKCQVNKEFFSRIKKAAQDRYIPYDEKTKLFEQNDGFFSLPHIDIDSIPNTDFPLYSHWSYDRIYRYDRIKQPDVLRFRFLYSHCFTKEQKEQNYDYYEPRCIHESSLSPSIHSIFATELGKKEAASRFFSYATRLDLDDYNRNTLEGIHRTSLAASFRNIVYGFGGLRSDGEVLSIAPICPEHWNSYSFKFHYQGSSIEVEVYKDHFVIRSDKAITIEIYGKNTAVSGNREFPLEEL